MQYTAIRNRYTPTSLVPNPYGWTGSSTSNRADVPTALIGASNVSSEEVQRTLAYEWLESGQLADHNYANPPFTSGAAGRLLPSLVDEFGQSAKILRGFIRRAQWEAGDPVTKARLYFMYNPETIERQYISYLDQSALDPFNTVYQSGNLVAPPSLLDFNFDLFFDRQTEAMHSDHPGVFVDYQFFDLVVRNVIPTDPNQSSNQLPDNGVMMVNPRDITVVFSPQLTVQGRPTNASVRFEKFTHRMIPTRMSISLQMRVTYFGPLLEQSQYQMQAVQDSSALLVPPDQQSVFSIVWSKIVTTVSATADQSGLVGAANAGVRNSAAASTGSGDAQSRGWGAPCSGGIIPLSVDGVSFPAGVNRGIHDLCTLLLRETRKRGYSPISGQCWGYNCAKIPGSSSWSNHAFGLAIDINAPENPQTSHLVTNMPSWMPALWTQYGFRWGGTYHSNPDAMHYEFMGTPESAQFLTAVAVGKGIGS